MRRDQRPGLVPSHSHKAGVGSLAPAAITTANGGGGERCQKLHPIWRMGDRRWECDGGASQRSRLLGLRSLSSTGFSGPNHR
jgi:hypothetical protein